jgi:3-phosphoshikimate 1-carboxyvinyltransferase
VTVDLLVRPGSRLEGTVAVPGDKSIAHRWLILSVTAKGASRLVGLPPSLDVRSTASCLAALTVKARPSLDLAAREAPAAVEGGGSTWNAQVEVPAIEPLEVQAEGRDGLVQPAGDLDCGNSGTSMRLLAGVVAAAPFRTVLRGDTSLSTRPMERVAEPLRRMGARVGTTDGHPPLTLEGATLRGIDFVAPVPSAQVKSAILLAGLAADGTTTVMERVRTRDHTERALEALGAPVADDGTAISVERFQHDGFEGRVPGDPSSAVVTHTAIEIVDVCLNPTRLHYLDVLRRMGVRTRTAIERTEVGEPVGRIEVEPGSSLSAVRVGPDELPLIIDEVPVLAAVAAHAEGDSWFLEASELRVKETDRLDAIANGIRALGGVAAEEGPDLVVGGGGLPGGRVDAGGDHRIAMALTVAALAADGGSRVDGVDAADVSFPGFARSLAGAGAELEPA